MMMYRGGWGTHLDLIIQNLVRQNMFNMFARQRNKVNIMCAEAKKIYYKEKLSHIRCHVQFYNIANKLLYRSNTVTLPNYECAKSLERLRRLL